MRITYLSLALIVVVFLINSSYVRSDNLGSTSTTSSSGDDPENCLYNVDGKKVNISSIPHLTFVDKTNNTGYTLSVCGPLGEKEPCGQMTAAVASCITKNYNSTGSKANSNGGYSIDPNGSGVTGYALSIKYTGGISCNMIKTFSIVNFQCGKTNSIASVTAGAWRPLGECFGQYTYVVDSPMFCKPGSGSKLTGGDVFLIIFFCSFGAYFIFGAIFLAIRGNRGADLIPNRGFWSGFGSLIKDGAVFIKNKITGGSNTTYQQI